MESSLGKRIAELRKKKGLTQDQLAEQFSVSAQAVSKWENDISRPDIAMLPQLADFFIFRSMSCCTAGRRNRCGWCRRGSARSSTM